MLQNIAALILFLFPLAFSPGPGNMFFAANGARFGFWSTVPANTGYHLATWVLTAAIGFGLIGALDQFPKAFVVLKSAGALYVFWIAWKLFQSGTVADAETATPAKFGDGIILLVLNPKAYVIIALMFTQFLGRFENDWRTPVIVITTVFTLNNLIAFLMWTMVGDKIAGLFKTQSSARNLNRMFGIILAAVAVWMFQF